MFHRPLSLTFLLIFVGSGSIEAADINRGVSSSQIAAIDRVVEQQMQQQQLVGVAIGVLRNGGVVLTRGYGLSDRKHNVKVTTDTLFNWASNSKPVMAMLAMQLVEQGKLNLDADIRQYVPEFPEKAHTITTRQLLCHQSGMPHYSNGQIIPTPGSRTIEQELDPLQAIKRFDRSPLIFEPHTRNEYSSHAYVLLSAVVQKAGGKPIQQQLDQRILKPLRLNSFQMDMPTNNQPHWSTGYMKNGRGDIIKSPEEANAWKHGAGAYKSNVNDFAKWAETLLTMRLARRSTYADMWTQQNLADGSATNYGLGPIVEGVGRNLKVSHNGAQQETKTRMVLYPVQRHGMVIMSNCNHANPGAISTAIYQALSTVR